MISGGQHVMLGPEWVGWIDVETCEPGCKKVKEGRGWGPSV